MGTGILSIQTVAASGSVLINHASITITDENNQVLDQITTDETGYAPDISLPAPDKYFMEDPYAPKPHYAKYRVQVRAEGYRPMDYEGVLVFDTTTSLLTVEMEPMYEGAPQEPLIIPAEEHHLDNPVPPEPQQLAPRIMRDVIVPNYITVHLGRPEVYAQNVRVRFTDYIKNVASHEIYDEWPEQALIANIYCIVSLTLNRLYTEFYRTKGYSFDITNNTSIDQQYTHGGVKGARISAIVDRIFNYYLAVVGHREPFIALYNDGVTVNIPGRLSQWGSFYDARDRGMTAWQIIQKYYSQNLELRQSNIFSGPLESYPGYSLSQGARGDHVRTMQIYLNRILGRYTNIALVPDGIFGEATRNAVVTFQQIYHLPANGVIDRTTWYKISEIYAIEKALWEMYSEGDRIGVGTTPPTKVTRQGDVGPLVVELQFLLNFIGEHYSAIPFTPETSRFDANTATAVRAFQTRFGITADGVVGATTWRTLYDVYWGIRGNVPPPTAPPTAPPPTVTIPPFPGVSLQVGMSGPSVLLVQQAINRLAATYPALWRIAGDGVFGNGTRDAVMAAQRLFGLTADGIVGPLTWNRLMQEFFTLQPGGPSAPPPIPAYPGMALQVGSSGNNVLLVQQAINRLAPFYPSRLWRIGEDGIFGNGTRDAVMAFQRLFGLTVDGVVGPATWNRLMQEASGRSFASAGGMSDMMEPGMTEMPSYGAPGAPPVMYPGMDNRQLSQAMGVLMAGRMLHGR